MSASDPIDVLIGSGAAKSVMFTDANGTTATVVVKGPGAATVTFDGTGLSQSASQRGVVVSGTGVSLAAISATGTTTASTLLISTRGGNRMVTCGPITVAGGLRALTAPTTTVTGNITTGLWVAQVNLAGANSGTITIGPSRLGVGSLALKLGGAVDESLTSAVPIHSITAAQWVNSGGTPHTIMAPSADGITIKNGFDPGIVLTTAGARPTLARFRAGTINGGTWNIAGGAGSLAAGSVAGWNATFSGTLNTLTVSHDASMALNAGTIRGITVRGTLSNSTIQVNDPLTVLGFELARLTVGGDVVGTTVRAIGSIGTVTAASLRNSQVYAGMVNLPMGQPLPTAPTDFVNNARLAALRLRRGATASFANSDVAAADLGSIDLGNVSFANAGTPFGLATHQIQQLTVRDQLSGKTLRARRLNSPATLASIVAAQGINLQDFVIRLL